MARSSSSSSSSSGSDSGSDTSSSRSRSPPPKGSKGGDRNLPVQKPVEAETNVLHISNLTRNVSEAHVREIFATYGELRKVELAMDRTVNLPKGSAHVEFASRADADKARLHMDGGQVDGNVVSVAFIVPARKQSPPPGGPPLARGRSPPRHGGGGNWGGGSWGGRRGRSPSPRRRAPPGPPLPPGPPGYGRRGASPARHRLDSRGGDPRDGGRDNRRPPSPARRQRSISPADRRRSPLRGPGRPRRSRSPLPRGGGPHRRPSSRISDSPSPPRKPAPGTTRVGEKAKSDSPSSSD